MNSVMLSLLFKFTSLDLRTTETSPQTMVLLSGALWAVMSKDAKLTSLPSIMSCRMLAGMKLDGEIEGVGPDPPVRHR